jgi:hypothetical protein
MTLFATDVNLLAKNFVKILKLIFNILKLLCISTDEFPVGDQNKMLPTSAFALLLQQPPCWNDLESRVMEVTELNTATVPSALPN